MFNHTTPIVTENPLGSSSVNHSITATIGGVIEDGSFRCSICKRADIEWVKAIDVWSAAEAGCVGCLLLRHLCQPYIKSVPNPGLLGIHFPDNNRARTLWRIVLGGSSGGHPSLLPFRADMANINLEVFRKDSDFTFPPELQSLSPWYSHQERLWCSTYKARDICGDTVSKLSHTAVNQYKNQLHAFCLAPCLMLGRSGRAWLKLKILAVNL